ncbi:MAG TPA: 50S ribosomal protein L11 methyltransferase [Moraxellaceae bacterium]|nr:50S ribosomal protein L11 methyltransferase [Moraxellaceae bacterium]
MDHQARLTADIRRTLPRARIAPATLPDCGGLRLYLLTDDFPQGPLAPDEMEAALNEPAYWIFCWASGLALARRLLREPALVRGRKVLDFGAGSGVVACAAARAGAREVVACDIDPASLQACAANAALNGVQLRLAGDFFALAEDFDLVLAADVLYDRANHHFLDAFLRRAPQVLVADSRVKNLQVPPYVLTGEEDAGTLPDLTEFDEFRRVRFYEARR